MTLRVLFLLLLPFLLIAGSNPKSATAVRTPKAPTIDGKLNEPEWQLAKPETDFVQLEPIEGARPNERTEIRFLFDDEALYVGCRMFDSDPSKIVARLARRDDEIEADFISLRIDSYNDNQTNYEFTVNAAGVKTDILQFDDGRKEDPSWDVVWEAETSIDSEGWIAELKIPFRVLRFAQKDEHEWGLQIVRRVTRTQEHQYWVLIRKSESGWASKFGHLRGIQNIPSATNLELLPYVVGSGRFVPASPAYPNGRELKSDAGFDLKYRPSPHFTIDATINPDFGQVEADPAVLNLSTYQTFYPEKRPFFIEGSQIIRFSTFGDDFGPGLFYSRRIGRPIWIDPPAGGYVQNEPYFATILGAAKISGKTQDGLSIGVLEAVSREERSTFVDSLGARSDQVVEPLSNYSVFRLRKDILDNSNVGMIATAVSRDGMLPAMTGGLDWNVRFQESMYRLDGFLAGSHTTHADPIAQSVYGGGYIGGSAGKVSFNKEGGDHWRWTLGYDFTSKQYNINDIGFFRRPNDHGTVNTLQYREDIPSQHILRWDLSTTYHYRTNFDNAELINSLQLRGEMMLPSYWGIDAEIDVDQGKYDDRETRGNGLYRKPATQNFLLQFSTDPRLPVTGALAVSAGKDARSSSNWTMRSQIEVKAASNITLQFSLNHTQIFRTFAWAANLTSFDDPLLPANRTHSIFAERTVSEWDFTSRGSFVFTHNLTLQYYVQLFFAKGKYEDPGRMLDESTFVPYTYSKSDFNELYLNSNVVLRWEYLPGSTAYLVWSHSRMGERGLYATPFVDNFGNVFGLPSTNVLLLKVSYWLSY
jgi:hypothetical protein